MIISAASFASSSALFSKATASTAFPKVDMPLPNAVAALNGTKAPDTSGVPGVLGLPET